MTTDTANDIAAENERLKREELQIELQNFAEAKIERLPRGITNATLIPARIRINSWIDFTSPVPESNHDAGYYNRAVEQLVRVAKQAIELRTAAEAVLSAWEHSKDTPTAHAKARFRDAISQLYDAVLPATTIRTETHTLSNFRVEYVKPDYSRGHSFEPRCAILADDAQFDGATVRVFDVPDPDESQREIAQFACDAMNEHGRLIEALKGIAIMLNTELSKYESEPWAQRVRAALTD